jgi:hypothetical protein
LPTERESVTAFDTVRIEISQPSLIDDPRTFLADCSCELEVRGKSVYASPPARLENGRLGRIQLDGFLHAWRALHPGVEVRIDGMSPAPPPPIKTSLSRGA